MQRMATCGFGVAILALVSIHPAAAAGDGAAWTRQFGTTAADEAVGVAVDPAGDAYVVGWTAGTLPGQTSAGTVDAFARKYDPAGQELWTRQFGSVERDFARAVVVDTAGDAYVVGETHGSLPGQHSAGGVDAFIRKYDPAGQEIWTRQFGSGGGEGASGVAVDAGGAVYVVGSTAGALNGQRYAGSFDAFVRRYDALGNEVWTRQFGTPAADFARGVAVDRSGNVFVAGSTEGALAGATAGGFDAYIRQYDPAGREVWTRQFGSSADDYGVGVATDPAGNPTVVGSTDGALPGQTSDGGTEAFLRRFDPAGTAVWTRQFGGGSTDEGWGVAVDAGGDTFVVGTTEPPPALLQTAPTKTHCFARKYDPAGRAAWVSQFGTDGTDLAYSVAVDPAGYPHVAGSTTGTLPGQASHGERDAYVLKLGRGGELPNS